MEQWEYKVEYIPTHGHDQYADIMTGKFVYEVDLEKHLNKLGEEGWELIQIPAGLIGGECADGYALFKRKKEI